MYDGPGVFKPRTGPDPNMDATMSKADGVPTTPLPEVPPDWVPVAVLPRLLAVHYRDDRAIVASDAAEAVWSGRLRFRHRIVGVEPYVVNSRRHGTIESWPPGLEHTGLPANKFDPSFNARWGDGDLFSSEPDRLVALDWTKADANRLDGTVGGWPDQDRSRVRHTIEVPWAEVRKWADRQIKRWKLREGTDVPATPSGEASRKAAVEPPPVAAAKGGRPPTYDWPALTRELIHAALNNSFSSRREMAVHVRR